MQTPQTPEPSKRPSSVVRGATPPADADPNKPLSEIAEALPRRDPDDDTPTIISMSRGRQIAALGDGLKGRRLGHFELLEPLGVGGMAAVIRATDLQLGRVVALKILPPEMAADPENITRFKNEARAAAKLDHENIARVYFCGEDQGLHFIAFEFVAGEDLRSLLIHHGPLSPADAVKYMLQIATGLAHAAERDIVHRDIKPSNILITPEGRAKIVDMGLARHVDPVQGAVTQSGVTLGTFDYISPEQAIEPRAADIRSDIYSLGCTFYHLLTGQPPVPEGTALKKLHHHQHVAPVDPRQLNPAIPDELAAVLAKTMAKEPRDRYQRPEQLIQHLIHVAQKLQLPSGSSDIGRVLFMDAPLPSPPRYAPLLVGLVGVAAVALLVALLGLGDSTSQSRTTPPSWLNSADVATTAPTTANPAPADFPMPPAVATSRQKQAQTIDDMVQFAPDASEEVNEIRLVNAEYNLSSLSEDVRTRLAALTSGAAKLRIVGAAGGARARVVLDIGDRTTAQPDYDAAIRLVGKSASQVVEFENIRFEIRGVGNALPCYAVAAEKLGKVSFTNCEFVNDAPQGGGVFVREAATTEFEKCLFAHGSVAISLDDLSALKANQCAFGPHDVAVLLREEGLPLNARSARLRAELSFCSVLMNKGTVFRSDGKGPGTIRAADCVFSGSDGQQDDVILVQQTRRGQTLTYSGPAAGTGRNAYYNLTIWTDADNRRARSKDDCTKLSSVRFDDAGCLELAQSPWQLPVADVKAKIADDPAAAFALKTDDVSLRLPPSNDAMIGAQSIPQYAAKLPPPRSETPNAAADRLTVDSTLPPEEARRRFEQALRDAKAGDTITIRGNGVLDVKPVEFDAEDLQLTIQAEAGAKPVLLFSADSARPHAAMFTLYNGRVTFKDLRFRVAAAQSGKARSRSVVEIIGPGQASFENCAATLAKENGDQALVSLATDNDASDGSPQVSLKKCFVRGRGDLLLVRGSQPFNLELDTCVVALDGSLASVLGRPKEEPRLSPQALITCRRVTAYLNESFLELRSTDPDRKVAGLVPTQLTCDQSLFVAAADKSFVHAVGVGGDALKQLLVWSEGSKGNLYGNYQKMLHAELPDAMNMMMQGDMTPKQWLAFTHESEVSFPLDRVIVSRPPTGDIWTTCQPDDFRPRFSDMKRSDVNLAEIGATAFLKDLPQLDEK
ncbi:MAG: serine/threonine-protein kinase [Gemmataceae bacterium]